jgi:hypothetical protein
MKINETLKNLNREYIEMLKILFREDEGEMAKTKKDKVLVG